MEKLPDAIVAFLSSNKVASICYIDEFNKPQCFTAFFSVVQDPPVLVFKSSHGTAHEDATSYESEVAGSILPDKLDVLNIQGVQFNGRILCSSQIGPGLISSYYNQYPFARVKSGYIWAIRLEFIKFTNNALVFGHKTMWSAV